MRTMPLCKKGGGNPFYEQIIYYKLREYARVEKNKYWCTRWNGRGKAEACIERVSCTVGGKNSVISLQIVESTR